MQHRGYLFAVAAEMPSALCPQIPCRARRARGVHRFRALVLQSAYEHARSCPACPRIDIAACPAWLALLAPFVCEPSANSAIAMATKRVSGSGSVWLGLLLRGNHSCLAFFWLNDGQNVGIPQHCFYIPSRWCNSWWGGAGDRATQDRKLAVHLGRRDAV